jgi:hypothetical protein
MISVEELFKETTYPTWIRTHQVFKQLKHIRKVFPDLGIPNFEDKIIIDNSKEITTFANQLLTCIADSLQERSVKITDFSKKGRIGKKRRAQINFLLSLMDSLTKSLRSNQDAFIVKSPSGKISLNLPEDLIYEDTLFMKKGAGLFKIYEKINSILKENSLVGLTSLNTTWQFKNFSSINIPSKETFVKFTSDGKDGIWDIATMSMRGVLSCQSWDAGIGNGGKVVGSMIDPFTGIIYLTCGTNHNHYGSKMVRRCVVRYAIDNGTKEPYLLLEKMYPAFDKPSLDTFINALKKRNDKIPIHYSGDIGTKATSPGKLSQSYIPLSDELKMLEARFHPYVDSGVSFREDTTCSFTKDTSALKLNFKQKIPQLFEKAIQSRIFKKEAVKPFGADALSIISQIRGTKIKAKTAAAEKKNGRNQKKVPELTSAIEQVGKLSDQLGSKFADFVCNKSEGDPFKYLEEHKQECEQFFASEFGEKIDAKFANFLNTNITSYISKENNTNTKII